MGDFLGNLVTKSLDLADVVVPRPVSIFEPAPKEGGPLTTPPPDGALLAARGETPPAPGTARQASRSPGPHQAYGGLMPDPHHLASLFQVPSRPGAMTPEPTPRGSEPVPVQTQPGLPTPQRPEAIRTVPEPVLPVVEADLVQRSAQAGSPPARKSPDRAPAPQLVAGPAARPEPIPATPEPRRPPKRTQPLPDTGSQEPIRDRSLRPRPAVAAEPDTAPAQPAGDRQRAAIPELAAPSAEQAPSPRLPTSVVVRPQIAAIPFAPESTAETVPTIQVTIGRVEVRAVPPPPAPPKPQARPPVMTLDEYLRQRNQGGQR